MFEISQLPAHLAERAKQGSDGCWNWQGTIQKNGYGAYGKPRRYAHRLCYEALRGAIPNGLVIVQKAIPMMSRIPVTIAMVGVVVVHVIEMNDALHTSAARLLNVS